MFVFDGTLCIDISEQKLPHELILIMQSLNDTFVVRANGPKPNKFIDLGPGVLSTYSLMEKLVG